MLARRLLGFLLMVAQPYLSQAISPISVKGAKLYTNDGAQFYVKGVAYVREGNSALVDPLLDTDQCEIDAGLMKDIGVNTIRVYYVEPTGDHDGCMNTFASQGIYVWIDLVSPLASIDRTNPAYTIDMFNRYAAVIDTFSKYDNVLSFTAGNEVINIQYTNTAPYIKAVVRDVRAYRDARGYRKIPISYTSADVSELQLPTIEYLSCGDQDDAIEMFGMDLYSWCGNSSYQQSGYAKVYTQFQHINIPALFAEVGCNSAGPRTFGEVAAILGSVFPATFSGVVVYEWTEELNDYGLVTYPNSAETGFPSTLADYNNLGKVFHSATPVSTAWSSYTPTNSPPACPAVNSIWKVAGSASIPTLAQLNINTVTARTTYTSASVGAAEVTSRTSAATAGGKAVHAGEKAKNSSLSTGAIAGIAVGAVVLCLALVLAAFLILRRHKARKSGADGVVSAHKSEDPNDYYKPELPASGSATKSELDPDNTRPMQELDSRGLNEMQAGLASHELDDPKGNRPLQVFELPGSRPSVNELQHNGV